MVGAAVLCAAAAARSGAGLVRVGMVKGQQNNFVKRAPLEVTTMAFPEEANGQISKKAWPLIWKTIQTFGPDVVALGPGLGGGAGVEFVVLHLLQSFTGGMVLDADGLNVLSKQKLPISFSGPVVLTPHEGELSRLLKWAPKKISMDRVAAAKEAAQQFRAICLLKGAGTLITNGRQMMKNTTGNPAMASGGMGDVLTGLIAALWAQMAMQTLDTGLRAAGLGSYLHGLAADKAIKKFPERTLLASDLIDVFPTVFKHVFKGSDR